MTTLLTWIGGFTAGCGTIVALIWIADFTLTRVVRGMGWMGALLRFMWLDGNKKQALREEAERARRGEHP